jgi:hypothetical protein
MWSASSDLDTLIDPGRPFSLPFLLSHALISPTSLKSGPAWCRDRLSVIIPRFIPHAGGRERRETRWHTCDSARGQGQSRHFKSHFILPSPARMLVANGDAPAGTLATAPPPLGVARLLYTSLVGHLETLSSSSPLLSFPHPSIVVVAVYSRSRVSARKGGVVEAATTSPTRNAPAAARLAASSRTPPLVFHRRMQAMRSSHGGLLYPTTTSLPELLRPDHELPDLPGQHQGTSPAFLQFRSIPAAFSAASYRVIFKGCSTLHSDHFLSMM